MKYNRNGGCTSKGNRNRYNDGTGIQSREPVNAALREPERRKLMKNNNYGKNNRYVPVKRQEPHPAELSLSQQFIRYSETVTLEKFVKKGDVVYGQRITKRSDGIPLLITKKK